MPYQLPDGTTLSMDAPWSYQGVRYPANWLRLSTEADREQLGIVWVPDPQPYDQRFQWGWTEGGQPIWKDHTQLVEQWTQQTRTTAGALLAPSDWLVVRELDNGTPMPTEWKTWRQDIRLASETKVAAIAATADTASLAAYITGADYPVWPSDPYAPPEPAPADGIQPPVDGQGT